MASTVNEETRCKAQAAAMRHGYVPRASITKFERGFRDDSFLLVEQLARCKVARRLGSATASSASNETGSAEVRALAEVVLRAGAAPVKIKSIAQRRQQGLHRYRSFAIGTWVMHKCVARFFCGHGMRRAAACRNEIRQIGRMRAAFTRDAAYSAPRYT